MNAGLALRHFSGVSLGRTEADVEVEVAVRKCGGGRGAGAKRRYSRNADTNFSEESPTTNWTFAGLIAHNPSPCAANA